MLYDIYGPQRTNPIDFDDHVTLPLACQQLKVFTYSMKKSQCLLNGLAQNICTADDFY